MKEHYIANLKTGQEFMDFFLVKQCQVKRASNGKPYMDLVLGDRTGEISAKRWDLADEEVEKGRAVAAVGDVIKVQAIVTEFKGLKQLRVTRIRATNMDDGIEIRDYIKAAPEEGPAMYDFIMADIETMRDEDLKALCREQMAVNREKLLYYPAASRNHHAELSGLLWHTKRMLMAGRRLCEVYPNLDPDLLAAGVILHDMQKLNEIDSDRNGISDGYSFEGQLLGHLVMGVRELDKAMSALGFSDEKRVMVEHMILSHHYEPEFGSPKRPLFPEAEMLHYLDIVDARMYDMEDVLDKTEPGAFSERVWTLDNRRLYKRNDGNE